MNTENNKIKLGQLINILIVKCILGNEKGLFEMHDQMADLYLVKEIDRESLKSAVLTLHIQVSQFKNYVIDI